MLPYPEARALEAPLLPSTSIPEAEAAAQVEVTESVAQQRQVAKAALCAAPPDGRHDLELEGRIGETAPPAHEEAKPKRSSKPKAKPRAKAKAKEAPREDASHSSQASDRAPEAQEVEEIADRPPKVEESPKIEAPKVEGPKEGKGRGRPPGAKNKPRPPQVVERIVEKTVYEKPPALSSDDIRKLLQDTIRKQELEARDQKRAYYSQLIRRNR